MKTNNMYSCNVYCLIKFIINHITKEQNTYKILKPSVHEQCSHNKVAIKLSCSTIQIMDLINGAYNYTGHVTISHVTNQLVCVCFCMTDKV